MPKLNVKQNNSNVIKAFQVALETGHRNLLDNPWWGSGEVVNQRGITGTPANNAYCIDRWIYSASSGSNAISLGANGITFTPVSGQYMWMEQHMANASWLTGKTVTGSIMLADGTIYSGAVTVTTGNDYMIFNDDVGFRLYLDTSNNVVLRVGTTKTIRALKVELGSYSTLANDVPPDYGEELRKCMQYFVRWWAEPLGAAYISSSLNVAYMHINTGVHMRRIPTVSLSGAIQVLVAGGTIGVSSIEAFPALPTVGVTIKCNLSSSASVVGPASAYFNSIANYIDFSADL